MMTDLLYLFALYLFIGMIGAIIIGLVSAWEYWRYPSAYDFVYMLMHQGFSLVAWPIMLIIWIRNLKQRYI